MVASKKPVLPVLFATRRGHHQQPGPVKLGRGIRRIVGLRKEQ